MSDQSRYEFRAIGYVKNEFDSRAAPDEIRAVESLLVIDPRLAGGLQGIEVGQRVMVIFYFDRSQGFELLQHPRGDMSRLKQGVFSLRSPDRPNKIGVCVVEVLGIDRNILRVTGLDAINDTPLLDIKPEMD